MTAAPAATLLMELVRRGIELQASGDRLRYRPRSAMTPELAEKIRAYKPALLAILVGDYAAAERRPLADAPVELPAAADQINCAIPPAEAVEVRPPRAEPVAPEATTWYTDDPGELLPDGVVELARARDGWQPAAWRDRLLYLADRCETDHPDRAAELRLAAIVLMPKWHEAYQERAAIMQYETTPMTLDEYAQTENSHTLEQLAIVFDDPVRRRRAEADALAEVLGWMRT